MLISLKRVNIRDLWINGYSSSVRCKSLYALSALLSWRVLSQHTFKYCEGLLLTACCCRCGEIPARSDGVVSPPLHPAPAMPLMMSLFVNVLMQKLPMSSAEIRGKKAAHCTHNDRLPACP